MIRLAVYAEQHRAALDYDLLCNTGMELNDVGGRISYGAFRSFLQYLGPGSALARELHPEEAAWTMAAKTNGILADVYDVLAAINANLCSVGSGKRAQKPQAYPRPGKKEENKFGFRAEMSGEDFRKWIDDRRREHGGD
ncbi:MAG: hypothetical protein HUJ67_06275 [Ruminiclostridium sp.]|nr:hypothetical protein [Ruminiclostridium sp.]